MSGVGGGAILAVGLGIAALSTKPKDEDFEALLHQDIVASLRSEMSADTSTDFGTVILKFGCTLSIDDCANLARSNLAVRKGDLVVAKLATVPIDDKKDLLFVGAFNNWWELGPVDRPKS